MSYLRLIELIAFVLLGVALVFGVKTVLGWRTAALANGATATALSNTAVTTGQIASTGAAAQSDAAHVDITVHQQAATFDQRYKELKDEDPSVALWDGYRIPDSLRDLAHARRCALDRLADAEVGSGRTHSAEDGCVPNPAP